MEVAQIGKAIARAINHRHPYFRENPICTEVVEFASLAHDLGHPPFGHNGEVILNQLMGQHGGFEGNAQTLRILSKLAKKLEHDEGAKNAAYPQASLSKRFGLNPTVRCLASVLKYDVMIPGRTTKVTKGYFREEREVVQEVKRLVCGEASRKDFKTIECHIMDCADDIAYSTHDLEDAFKGGFLHPLDLFAEDDDFFQRLTDKVNQSLKITITSQDARDYLIDLFENTLLPDRIPVDKRHKRWKTLYSAEFYRVSERHAREGYQRGALTAGLISMFISHVEVELESSCPALSKVYLREEVRVLVELLKRFVYLKLISAPELKLDAHRGKKIISELFPVLLEDGESLLPYDYQRILDASPAGGRHRVIADFISGMTDRYAIELHTRIFHESTAFKPI